MNLFGPNAKYPAYPEGTTPYVSEYPRVFESDFAELDIPVVPYAPAPGADWTVITKILPASTVRLTLVKMLFRDPAMKTGKPWGRINGRLCGMVNLVQLFTVSTDVCAAAQKLGYLGTCMNKYYAGVDTDEERLIFIKKEFSGQTQAQVIFDFVAEPTQLHLLPDGK